MSIYLIRHGETALNRARVLQSPDTPLSDAGIAQAERLAARLANEPIAEMLVSDHERTQMTAAPIARVTGVTAELTSLLQERSFGSLRGKSYDELETFPFAPGYTPPEGESWEVFHRRVDRAWRFVTERARAIEATRPDRHLAVVTHGLVCHSLAVNHLVLPEGTEAIGSEGPILRLGNTALSIIEIEGSTYRTSLLGCTAHLEDGEALTSAS